MSWQRIGGRKFLLCLLTLLIASALVVFGHIAALIYRDIIFATVAAYIAGNVSQKVWGKEDA